MYFAGGKPRGGADGAVVGALDVWNLHVPVSLYFSYPHSNHLDRREMDAPDRCRAVEAGGNPVITEAFVDGAGDLGAELAVRCRKGM